MSRSFEVKTTVLPGHRIEICDPELPEGSAATVHVTVDEADAAFPVHREPDSHAAEQRYVKDLPQLLESKAGRWVAYAPQGLIAEGEDELALFRLCRERGLKPGEFFVARVEPDLPPAEVTDNWYAADAHEV
jgi:hypothetical protein